MNKQSGFSMIEILITIVVISFGFLSILALQMRTLNNLTVNNQEFVAMSIASSFGERVLANVNGTSFYNNLKTKEFTKDCSSSTCLMHEIDFWEFKRSLEQDGQLPDPSAEVQVAGGFVDITINWKEKSGAVHAYKMLVPL